MRWEISLMAGGGVEILGHSGGEDGVEIVAMNGIVLMTEFGKTLRPAAYPDIEAAMREAETYT